MRTNRLLIYLCCVGSLWLASCSPTDTAPLVVTRAVAQATVTPDPTATETTAATATPLPTATPETADPVLSSLTVTPTPDPALPTWTREPSRTPTIQPTFTPIAGPVRPILFAGRPCIEGHSRCADADSWDGKPDPWYQIYSDGTGLRRIPQMDHPESMIQQRIRFSPDESMMAYIVTNQIYLVNLQNNSSFELASLPANYWAILSGFDFVPDSDCLYVYWRSDPQTQTTETLSIERACPNQPETQLLTTIDLPDLRAGSASGYFSPQGDALLIVGWDNDDNRRLYVQELFSTMSPQLLYTIESRTDDNIIHMNWELFGWQPDGQHIQFINNAYRTYDEVAITHYVISRDGQKVEANLLAEASPFGLCCSCSPDNLEIAIRVSDSPAAISGIHIFDIETGTWRQILAEYYISRGPFWIPELP